MEAIILDVPGDLDSPPPDLGERDIVPIILDVDGDLELDLDGDLEPDFGDLLIMPLLLLGLLLPLLEAPAPLGLLLDLGLLLIILLDFGLFGDLLDFGLLGDLLPGDLVLPLDLAAPIPPLV